ncbi:MAG: hypothetical protein R2788_09720 [Saprospiraceae bacterium]
MKTVIDGSQKIDRKHPLKKSGPGNFTGQVMPTFDAVLPALDVEFRSADKADCFLPTLDHSNSIEVTGPCRAKTKGNKRMNFRSFFQ